MKTKQEEITKKAVVINAKDKVLGRLAQKIATILRGKDSPDFLYYTEPKQKVIIYNTDKLKFTGKKLEQKKYYRHSGYPGGIKEEPLERLMGRDSRVVLQKAVHGMLPKNKLRPKALKNLSLFKQEPPQGVIDNN